MKGIFAAMALAASLAVPALAQGMDKMTCAAFTAMDGKGQMDALAGMEQGGMMASGGMAAGNGMAAGVAADETAKAVATTCADHPEMMVDDAMMAH